MGRLISTRLQWTPASSLLARLVILDIHEWFGLWSLTSSCSEACPRLRLVQSVSWSHFLHLFLVPFTLRLHLLLQFSSAIGLCVAIEPLVSRNLVWRTTTVPGCRYFRWRFLLLLRSEAEWTLLLLMLLLVLLWWGTLRGSTSRGCSLALPNERRSRTWREICDRRWLKFLTIRLGRWSTILISCLSLLHSGLLFHVSQLSLHLGIHLVKFVELQQ